MSENISEPNPDYEKTKTEILALAKELEQTLPEYQGNVRTPATQQLLDFVAKVYGVPPYTTGLETGKYVSWLQDQDSNGYEASFMLNAPRKALKKIMESAYYEALVK